MKANNFNLFLTTFIVGLTLNVNSQALLDKSQWELVWWDEFNEPNITSTAFTDLWSLNFAYGSGCDYTQWCNLDEAEKYNDSADYNHNHNVILDGAGHLLLKAIKVAPYYEDACEPKCGTRIPKKYFKYSSGMIKAKTDIAEGMFEARIKLPAPVAGSSNGFFPAFWHSSGHGIQFLESGGNVDLFSQSVDNVCHINYTTQNFPDLTQEYHTYSGVWHGNKVVFYFDGKETFTVNDITHTSTGLPQTFGPGNVIVNFAVNSWSDFDNATMYIDYVKVYKPKVYNTTGVSSQLGGQTLDYNNALPPNYPTNISESKMSLLSNTKLFYRSNNAELYEYNKPGSGTWQTVALGTQTDVQGDVTAKGNRVYYRSTNNVLKYFEYSGGTWINNSTSGTDCGGSISIANSGLVIFKKNSYPLLMSYNPATGNTSTITSNANVGGGIIITPNGNNIYYHGSLDNKLWKTHWNGSAWGTPAAVANSNTLVTNEIVYEASSDKIYFIGSDNTIYQYYYDGVISSYATYPLSAASNASKYLTLDSNGGTKLYYMDAYNKLWYCFNDQGWAVGAPETRTLWYRSAQNPDTLNATLTGPIVVKNNNQLFYRTSDSKLQNVTLGTGEVTYSPCDVYIPIYNKSVDEYSEDYNGITLYPMPTQDVVNMELEPGQEISEIRIYNQFGTIVAVINSPQIASFSVADLPNGLYFCVMKDSNNTILKKILKQ